MIERITVGGLVLALIVTLAPISVAADPTPPDMAYGRVVEFNLRPRDEVWKVTAQVTVTKKFLTERSADDRQIVIPEDPYGVISGLEVRRNGDVVKNAVTTHYPQYEDVFFNEFRVWVVSLPAKLKAGDEVTVTYDVVYDEQAYLPVFYLPSEDLLDHYEVRFDHPDNVTVDFDVFNPREPVPMEITRPSTRLTVLRVDSLLAAPVLPYFEFNGIHAAVLANVRTDAGPVTPTSIADFAAWYDDLVGPPSALTEPLDAELAAGLAAAGDDLARLAAIHDFVRSSVRYVHDAGRGHRFVPAEPAVVLANRYGDCKDRAFLVQALAEREGVAVDVALISTRPYLRFTSGTDVFLFNHVINVFETPDGPVFFDPTGRHVPFGELPEPVIGREALVLSADAPYQMTVPVSSAAVSLDVTVTADLDSLETGTATVELRGPYFIAASEVLAQYRGLDRENALDAIVNTGLNRLDLDRYRVVAEEPALIRLEARADLGSFVVSSPSRVYLPRAPFGVVNSTILERGDDDEPIHIESRENFRLQIDLHTPSVTAVADTTRLGTAAVGWFSAAMTPAADEFVRLEYAYDRQRKLLAGQDKSRFLEFCRSYLGAKRDLFTLERVSP